MALKVLLTQNTAQSVKTRQSWWKTEGVVRLYFAFRVMLSGTVSTCSILTKKATKSANKTSVVPILHAIQKGLVTVDKM